jgi:hypothetical protein
MITLIAWNYAASIFDTRAISIGEIIVNEGDGLFIIDLKYCV